MKTYTSFLGCKSNSREEILSLVKHTFESPNGLKMPYQLFSENDPNTDETYH